MFSRGDFVDSPKMSTSAMGQKPEKRLRKERAAQSFDDS